MKINIENLKIFYSSFLGKSVIQIISKKIFLLWPDFNNSRNAVIGYGFPFLGIFKSNFQRLFFLVPKKFGLFNFSVDEKNLTVSVNEYTLPLDDLSIDRLLVVNCFEYLYNHKKFLREAWRVLEKDGEIIIVTPNTFGFWSFFYKKNLNSLRTFNSCELNLLLSNNFFTPLDIEYSLFLPPSKSRFLIDRLKLFEFLNNALTKYFSGVIIIKGKKNYLVPVKNNKKLINQKIKGDIKA
ncbi:MAG: methyltransferase domain-containing protein [Rhizobiales bacterium TMED94]|nr:hypothetical protein [Rhodobiaceae bacterium]RPF86348.1 MAG: methyltransferase domain-containing protein [Rhizobiales bacterium TMED94]